MNDREENSQRAVWIYEKAKNVEQYPYHFPICLIPFHIWDRDSGFGNEGKPSYRYRYIRLSSGRKKYGEYDYVPEGYGLF